MTEDITPKIILNDDYVDLRKYVENNSSPKKSRTTIKCAYRKISQNPRILNVNTEGFGYERELINCGLQKLATSFNATVNSHQRQNVTATKRKQNAKEKTMADPRFRRVILPEEKSHLKSQSEFSVLSKKFDIHKVSPSTPVFNSQKTSDIEMKKTKIEPVKGKGTMTKKDREFRGKIVTPRCKPRSKSKDRERKTGGLVKSEAFNPKKYGIAPSAVKDYTLDAYDRQTYMYDDGTEVDSAYIEEKPKQIFGKAFQNQCMAFFLLGGCVCGILLVSLLIWFIFGHNLMNIFFKPRKLSDGTVKKYIKYVGGSFIYVVTTFFKTLGRVLAIPTQKVYQSQPENYRWPLHPQNNI